MQPCLTGPRRWPLVMNNVNKGQTRTFIGRLLFSPQKTCYWTGPHRKAKEIRRPSPSKKCNSTLVMQLLPFCLCSYCCDLLFVSRGFHLLRNAKAKKAFSFAPVPGYLTRGTPRECPAHVNHVRGLLGHQIKHTLGPPVVPF